jgi:hypothetical protein
MPPDPYDDDDERQPRRSSSATSNLSVTKDVGPLPVWGWFAVAVAAVYLWRKIGGKGGATTTAAQATGMTAPGYSPANSGVYLLPGTSSAPAAPAAVPNSTGTTPAPAPSYLPVYPAGGSGQAPAGSQCPPGYTLIQGPSGYTCATGPQAIALGQYLAAVGH